MSHRHVHDRAGRAPRKTRAPTLKGNCSRIRIVHAVLACTVICASAALERKRLRILHVWGVWVGIDTRAGFVIAKWRACMVRGVGASVGTGYDTRRCLKRWPHLTC
eukprot:7668555-Pyramimonas_sp.AAC.1